MNIKMKSTLVFIALYLLTACSLPISSFSQNLNKAVKANNDPQTVIRALPSYLILMDSLLQENEEDKNLLLASSKLILAYSGLLSVESEMMMANQNAEINEYQVQLKQQQIKKLTKKALNRASKAFCLLAEKYCGLTLIKYTEFEKRLESMGQNELEYLYLLGRAWVAWLQVNTDDWNAMAQIPQIKLIMNHVVEINENWDSAGAHMYLGVLNSLLPNSLGGKPALGKKHFEKAIELSQGKNLMIKVLYAQYYARLTFDKNLHTRLINEVNAYNNSQKQYILINTLAKEKAKALEAGADDYF